MEQQRCSLQLADTELQEKVEAAGQASDVLQVQVQQTHASAAADMTEACAALAADLSNFMARLHDGMAALQLQQTAAAAKSPSI
jgi:thiamine phosphate synthase YjbQ (UPF0047 family)